MLEQAKRAIELYLPPSDRLLVGLSGGADSIALAHLLYSLGYRLYFVHINFHLRGSESDRDEQFVTEFVGQHLPNAHLCTKHVDTIEVAKERGISIEMAARELRYSLFETLRMEQHCNWIVVGHHANDQIETALLNLARGTGGKGLAGMKMVNGHIFRPFLTTWKQDLLHYLSCHQLSYVSDSTNFDTTIKRNYIRHKLIPSFEQLNPSFANRLLENIGHFREEQEVLEVGLHNFLTQHFNRQEMSMEIEPIGEPYYLKRWLRQQGFTPQQTTDIVECWKNPKTISFASAIATVELYRGTLYLIDPNLHSFPPEELKRQWSAQQVGTITVGQGHEDTIRLHERYKNKAITVRMGRSDDRFSPFGMKLGSKPLFRYLGEKGLPEYYRPYCPVLECEGKVIAVLPFEVSEQAKYKEVGHSILVGFTPAIAPLGAITARLAKRSGEK